MPSTHYSHAQQPECLSPWAKRIAEQIRHTVVQPVLVYTGMSGIAAATAISLWLHENGTTHGMAYVRKEHEQSHGGCIEYQLPNSWDRETCIYIFVDDLVDTGATLNRCKEKIKKEYGQITKVCL